MRQKQTEFGATASQETARPQEISQSHADRAQREIGAGASKAEQAGRSVSGRYPGGDEKAQDQRKAAEEVSRETAADIRKKGPEAASTTRSGAGELGGKHRELITQVHTRMTQFLAGITGGVQQLAAQSRPSLTSTSQSTLQALDTLRQSSVGALERARALAIQRIQAAGRAAQGQIRESARARGPELDQMGRAGGAAVKNTAQQTRDVLMPIAEPNPRGAQEMANSAHASITGVAAPAAEAMAGAANSAKTTFGAGAADLGRQLKEQSAATTVSSQGLANNVTASAAQAASGHATSLEQVVTHAQTQQQGLVTSGVTEVADAGRTSLDEMRGKNAQLDGETARAANDSIAKSTEPAAQVSDRADQAATRAGEEHEKSWFGKVLSGIWSAIKSIAKGLVIALAVAVVLVALAALAGFTLGLGTALLIVGATFLIVGGIQAYRARSAAHPDAGVGALLLMSLSDVTGATGVYEAVTGKDSYTGEKLDAEERARRGTLGAVTLFLTAAGIRGSRGLAGSPKAGPLVTRPTRFPPGMSASARILTALKGMIPGGRVPRPPSVARIANALKSAPGRALAWFKSKLNPKKNSTEQPPLNEFLELLRARQEQIRSARGDVNVFRARVRAISNFGDTPQNLTTLAPRLNQLLTPHRRVQVMTGGGRRGSGVSTHVESLDGMFSIRITHNQVGANPVGNPPAPRIHIYEGAVSGHGKHIVFPTGTTLADILRALQLGP